MAKKYYAVKYGRVPGVYESWEDCKRQTDGFPEASYKGFSTQEEAENFIGGPEPKIESSSEAVAYVDGSYDETQKEFAYGVVIFFDNTEEHFSAKMNDPALVDMRNVAGEIKAAEKAMQFCIDKGIKSIDIYYDYQGIEKWCTGEWAPKKVGTKAYKAFYESIKPRLTVNFIKVKAHSDNQFNDLADQLAKSALGIGKQPDVTQGDNYEVVNNIKKSDFEKVLELLKQDIPELNIEVYKREYHQEYMITIKSQTLKAMYYENKSKILLQGKKESLFNQFSSYIVELLEPEEISTFLNTVNELKIDENTINIKYHELLPNASKFLKDKVSKVLHQAVYNLNIYDAPYDATYIADPAIRVVEAILKMALKEHDLPTRNQKKQYDYFFIFKKQRN